jgi:hypothetical protein
VAKRLPKSLSAFSLLGARWAPPRKSNRPLSHNPTSLFVGESTFAPWPFNVTLIQDHLADGWAVPPEPDILSNIPIHVKLLP